MGNEISQLKPFQDRVLVKIKEKKKEVNFQQLLLEEVKKSESENNTPFEGIITPFDNGNEEEVFENQGTVISLSDSVEGLKVGDKVIFEGGNYLLFKGERYILCRAQSILYTIN